MGQLAIPHIIIIIVLIIVIIIVRTVINVDEQQANCVKGVAELLLLPWLLLLCNGNNKIEKMQLEDTCNIKKM